eukprot:6490527-Amphidinium_carterae.2
MDDDSFKPEQPIKINIEELCMTDEERDKGKLNNDTKTYYNNEKALFVVDALQYKSKRIKEFNGCYHHGCPHCYPECVYKYNKTTERKNILEKAGYTVDFMWECQWKEIKKSLPNKKDIEEHARHQNIITRNGLCGGRTEGFKSYLKCCKRQKIFYVDVCSLYPSVNALDDYAVGFKKYVNITVDDILSDKFIGLVKCDVIPPKDLYIPVLPDNSNGKLLFHLQPMYEKTWASVELKKALEKGYKITKIHSAVQYKRFNDSVIFVYDETNPNHKSPEHNTPPSHLQFGNGLGQWEDEFHGQDHIVEIVVGGAKSYAYKTAKGKVVVKQKGITLNRSNDDLINFETMKNMVLNQETLHSSEKAQFKWDTLTKDVITKNIARSIKSTINEKRNVDGYDTLPFGYQN